MDTIFALSSGMPPAGIGVIRVTGPQTAVALETLAGRVPRPRFMARAVFRDGGGEVLDDGLMVYFPGPNSVTGEDLAELHCHGGRATIAAVQTALASIEGCRRAEPGEFTRRAFANGRLDLAEAEGLADLLSAETEVQRRAAVAMAGGAFSRRVEEWRTRLLLLSAEVEAALDFAEEDEVSELTPKFRGDLRDFAGDLQQAFDAPSAETLREGFRVALAGPPNAGKSTLFNALTESEAAIIADIAGTTRDVLVRPVAIAGIPFSFVDMAGLRDSTGDTVEAIGISRAQKEIAAADLVLWLGPEGQGPKESWEIEAQCDRAPGSKKAPRHRVSAVTGEGLAELRSALIERARKHMPAPGEAALNQRQRSRLADAAKEIHGALERADPLLVAEHLRRARLAFDALLGRTSTEDVLDTIFGRFCLGK